MYDAVQYFANRSVLFGVGYYFRPPTTAAGFRDILPAVHCSADAMVTLRHNE